MYNFNLSFIRDLFKKHVVAQGNTGGISGIWLVFPAFLLSCTPKNGQRQENSGVMKKR